jgi:hypothetical protein
MRQTPASAGGLREKGSTSVSTAWFALNRMAGNGLRMIQAHPSRCVLPWQLVIIVIGLLLLLFRQRKQLQIPCPFTGFLWALSELIYLLI